MEDFGVLCTEIKEEHCTIDPESAERTKPEIIMLYDSTKIVVITVYQIWSTYSVSRNVKLRPMIIFSTLLNVSNMNFQVINVAKILEPSRRRRWPPTRAYRAKPKMFVDTWNPDSLQMRVPTG